MNPIPGRRSRAGRQWRQAAEAWIKRRPDVMSIFEKLAHEIAGRGKPFGIGALSERVRWFFKIERGDETFKINNNFRAYIARELVRRHPRLKNLVEFRATADEAELGRVTEVGR